MKGVKNFWLQKSSFCASFSYKNYHNIFKISPFLQLDALDSIAIHWRAVKDDEDNSDNDVNTAQWSMGEIQPTRPHMAFFNEYMNIFWGLIRGCTRFPILTTWCVGIATTDEFHHLHFCLFLIEGRLTVKPVWSIFFARNTEHNSVHYWKTKLYFYKCI